jgi:redox-sensitive bicupin YhaK (pirin superfamily)
LSDRPRLTAADRVARRGIRSDWLARKETTMTTATMKQVVDVLSAPPAHWVGDGFPVRSMFSIHGQEPAAISPFLLLDHAGPHAFPPDRSGRPRGVDEHPHRGFETVTIVYQGELEHRDSAGNSGRIGPGDVQWMTAASGVVHEEKHAEAFTRRGGTLEMIQLWVNLPARQKMATPRYQEILNASIPTVKLGGQGASVRVIAGALGETAGPARTVTPMNLWDVRLDAGVAVDLPVPGGHNTIVLVLRGSGAVAGVALRDHHGAVLDRAGDAVSLRAGDDGATLLLLSGEPIDEPVAAQGPFVMNTADEIRQAIADYRSGRMGRL